MLPVRRSSFTAPFTQCREFIRKCTHCYDFVGTYILRRAPRCLGCFWSLCFRKGETHSFDVYLRVADTQGSGNL